jgi:hypothetical protein
MTSHVHSFLPIAVHWKAREFLRQLGHRKPDYFKAVIAKIRIDRISFQTQKRSHNTGIAHKMNAVRAPSCTKDGEHRQIST